MTATEKMAAAARVRQIEADIRDIKATVELIATDEGTHAMPGTTRVHQRYDGSMYSVYKFGGSNGTRQEIESLDDVETDGRVLTFPAAIERLKTARKRVSDLQGELKKLAD
mgnify:CR=1 FL=1